MALDWSQCPAVESVPGKLSGAWVFRGTRMPAATIFENLEDGMTIDEIIEQFDVTREQVAAVLDFAARSLEALLTADAGLDLIQGTPRGIARALAGQTVIEARARG